jgi:hypothetical protein
MHLINLINQSDAFVGSFINTHYKMLCQITKIKSQHCRFCRQADIKN